MLPRNRPPAHPGEMLLLDFLIPAGISQTELSRRTGMSLQRINTIISGKRGVTVETAVALSREFSNSAEFWINLQSNYDLWHAMRSMRQAG